MEFGAPEQTGAATARKKADGSTSCKAQIRRKEKGAIVHSETETFTRKALAQAWTQRREADLQGPLWAAGLCEARVHALGDKLAISTDQRAGDARMRRAERSLTTKHPPARDLS